MSMKRQAVRGLGIRVDVKGKDPGDRTPLRPDSLVDQSETSWRAEPRARLPRIFVQNHGAN